MKKLIIISLGLALLYGCSRPTLESEATKSVPDGIIPFDAVIHFRYKNHYYIKFTEGYERSRTSGVVHDPDCKYCKK